MKLQTLQSQLQPSGHSAKLHSETTAHRKTLIQPATGGNGKNDVSLTKPEIRRIQVPVSKTATLNTKTTCRLTFQRSLKLH